MYYDLLGICCSSGDGSYSVTYDGNEVASGGYPNVSFQYMESTNFGNCVTEGPEVPTTNHPTKTPSKSPVTSCSLALVDESCNVSTDCCSGLCMGGKKADRKCLSNEPTTSPPTVAATTSNPTSALEVDTSSPTSLEVNTPSPTISCGGNKASCFSYTDCCSQNCKQGQCKGE